MKLDTDTTVDVLVVGSGAAALTAALRAAKAGAEVLVIEKAPTYGGTSATSGGGLWIPCNHLMADVGVADSREDAKTYLSDLAGDDVDEASVDAFIDNAPRMLEWLERNSEVRYMAMAGYADYYQEIPGAKPGARSIDPLPYHGGELGDELLTLQEPHPQTRVMGMMGYTNIEGAILLSKAPGWWKVILKLIWLYFSDIPWRFRSRRSRRLTMGNALIARLRHSLMQLNVPLVLECPARELLTDGERVTGVRATWRGKSVTIQARRGVILASGGFEYNQDLREQYLPRPTRAEWSSAHPYNTGDMLGACENIGAAIHLMSEAWWGPSINVKGEDRSRQLFTERSMPGCIVVNKQGQRFFNESVCYTTAVQAMYEAGNLPAYAIFDSRYRREYPFGPLLPGGMHLNWLQPKHVRNDLLTKAHSLPELAEKLGIENDGLEQTVARFNGFAAQGTDEDFHRGENAYDQLYGDVRIQPNPCLAPVTEAPFYGIEIQPGDIGTKGGVLTNEHAQVMRKDGSAIPGLYAVGNCAASVTGRYYPGAGATLGPAMTFGFVAAEHCVADNAVPTEVPTVSQASAG